MELACRVQPKIESIDTSRKNGRGTFHRFLLRQDFVSQSSDTFPFCSFFVCPLSHFPAVCPTPCVITDLRVKPEGAMISPERISLEQCYSNPSITAVSTNPMPTAPPPDSRMKEIGYHQQFERQFRRDIHIRDVLRIAVLLVVVEVLTDLLQDHCAVVPSPISPVASLGRRNAYLLHVVENDLVLAGFGKVACTRG